MINRFAIYSPILGEREDYPHILLSKAVTKDNTAIQLWNGEIRKAKMRTPELMRSFQSVDSIDTSANTITITGNYVSQYANGASVTIYDTDDNYQTITLSTTSTYNSTSTVLTSTTSITLADADFVFCSDNVASADPSSVDFRKVGFPDSNAALDYRTLLLSDGTERLVGFTKDHIYYWDTSLTKWQVIHTCASSCTYWSTAIYGDNICATNNIDRPKYWDGNTANSFENLDTQYGTTSQYITKAKFVAAYHNYLFLGNVELSTGDRYKDYVYWSNIGDGVASGGFIQASGNDAGAAQISGAGEISAGFGFWQDYLVIFKTYSIRKLWFVGGTIPFEQSELFEDIGCTAPGSVGNDWDGNLYFYGSDKAFREISAGKISDGINKTARDINPSLLGEIRFLAVDEYNELRWAIPYGNSSTANNKLVVYKPKERRWDTDIDIAVTAFGTYTQQTGYTWDTLPYNSWDEWGWDSWDAISGQADYPVDICSDASGYTYALHGGYLDNGSEYNSSFCLTTDLADKQALPFYKRVLQIYVYVRKESSGTLTHRVKRDNETSWQSLGTINLTGDEDILRQRLAVDFRARHILLETSGTSKFSVLGYEFEFLAAGDR
jgi:hypothetical protein